MKVAVKDIVNTITQDEMDAGKLQSQFSIDVSEGSKVTLPEAFESIVRLDLVKLAVASSRANRRQAYGSRPHVGKRRPMSGMKHSVEWWGKGRGVSRIMRRTGQRRGAQNPHTLGGRRAHGPKVEKNWSRKLNLKERRAARNAALAATVSMDTVAARGHRVDDDVAHLPIVLGNYSEVVDGKTTEYDIEAFNHGSATRKAIAIFDQLGLGGDLDRARNGRKIRAGKATMRGRVHKTPKSVLLVVKEKAGLAQAVRNLPGVDVVAAKDLCAEDLAPGGDVGRLTVFTKSALEALN
ncbi:MAG: 50S ribosomal protein L4 [Candidatus Poseidonia sp.]|nr:50S ribosomal protein L4 [Poseidonia sp.]